MTITGVSPSSASPIAKTTFTIDGTNFGTTAGDLKVELVEKNVADPNIYKIAINSVNSDGTQI